jgi:hypothetical protein
VPAEPVNPANLVEAIARLIDAFEASDIEYALGGAIAYSAWAEPRATRDVDLNLWLDLPALDRGLDILERAGVRLNRRTAQQDAARRGMFVVRLGEYRIDVFVPSVPFYEEARRRRVRTNIAHRDTWVLSAETLIVFKLLFFRPKDLADIGRVLQIQGDRLDLPFVRRWLVDMVGSADERVLEWDRLTESDH